MPRQHARLSGRCLAAALAAAALAAVPLACGGEDQPSEREFLRQGDEICTAAREQYVELQRKPPRTAAEAADRTGELIEISERELDELRSLDTPEALQDDLDRYLEAREEGIAIIREGLVAAKQGDAAAYAEAQSEVAEGQVRRTKLARAIGFTECSRPLTGDDLRGG